MPIMSREGTTLQVWIDAGGHLVGTWYDTAANWAADDPVLAEGQAGYDSDGEILKIGDGVLKWSALPSISGAGSSAMAAWVYGA